MRKNTAGAAIKTRDYTLSIESCNKVLELLPGDTKSLYRRALAQWRLGEVEKATEDLEAILKAKVSDYEQIQEASTAKKAARKLLRQIDESEERAEAVEVWPPLHAPTCTPHGTPPVNVLQLSCDRAMGVTLDRPGWPKPSQSRSRSTTCARHGRCQSRAWPHLRTCRS